MVYKKYIETNADVLYGDIEIREEYGDGIILNHKISNHLLMRKKMSIFHPATFVKRSVYKNFGVYSCDYRSASDYDFFLRLFLQGYRFVHVPFILASFLSGGLSGQNFKLSLTENYQIRKKQLGIISAFSYALSRTINSLFYKSRKSLFILIFGKRNYYKIKQKKSNQIEIE